MPTPKKKPAPRKRVTRKPAPVEKQEEQPVEIESEPEHIERESELGLKQKKEDNKLHPRQQFDWMRIVLIALALVLAIVGYMIASAWSENRSSAFLAMGPILMFPAAGYLLYRAIKGKEKSAVIVGGGSDKPEKGKPFNSLNIYAYKDEDTGKVHAQMVKWEYVEKPLGQPQQCTNNGKWYHVHIWDIEKQTLKAFSLPDSQYFDPREFANVIKMPAHQKLFERQATLLQKIAPAIMVMAFVASIIGFIATMPPPTG